MNRSKILEINIYLSITSITTKCTNSFNNSNSIAQIKGYLLNYVGFLKNFLK